MHAPWAVLACMLVACKPSDSARAPGGESAGVDRQKEEQTIRDMEARWRSSLTARDTAAIRTYYTEDAIYSPQGTPALRGRDAVSARWAREFLIPGFKLERTPIRIEIANSGDLATEVGTYDVQFQEKNQPRRATGTYTTTWRKTDEGWKIASYMWNQGAPEARR